MVEYIIISRGKYIFSTFNEAVAKAYLKKDELASIIISSQESK